MIHKGPAHFSLLLAPLSIFVGATDELEVVDQRVEHVVTSFVRRCSHPGTDDMLIRFIDTTAKCLHIIFHRLVIRQNIERTPQYQ